MFNLLIGAAIGVVIASAFADGRIKSKIIKALDELEVKAKEESQKIKAKAEKVKKVVKE